MVHLPGIQRRAAACVGTVNIPAMKKKTKKVSRESPPRLRVMGSCGTAVGHCGVVQNGIGTDIDMVADDAVVNNHSNPNVGVRANERIAEDLGAGHDETILTYGGFGRDDYGLR